MFTRGWRDVDALPNYADNSAVAAASGCKEVRDTFGGVCSEVVVDDSGGVLSLFLLLPLDL